MRRRLILKTLLCLTLAAPAAVVHADESAPSASPGSSLQAIVMDVQGKARWRPSADGEWRDAKVNDIVDPGTEIRTGLKGRLTLRVGKNATVLVDSGTEFHIPHIVQDGETLRTLATVKSGRVDFKVDKVGFSNDFKVVTPATTLSVRGTGFSLAAGPLQGVEVSGVRTNMINAIEVKYVASNATYFMSGAAQTSSERQDPVQSAWVSTVGPPPVVGTLADKAQLSQQVSHGQSGNAPTNSQSTQAVAGATANGQGGNSLIIAAQTPGASDALKEVAVGVTGNTSVANPSGGDARLRRLMAEELAFVRREAPEVLANIRDLDGSVAEVADALSVTSGERALGFDTSFQTVYFDPGTKFDETGGLQDEDGRWNLDLVEAIRQADRDSREIRDAVEGLLREADDPKLRGSRPLRLEVAQVDAWAQRERGHKIFTVAAPGSTHSSFLAEASRGGRSDPVPDAVAWLENARSWSRRDLDAMPSASLAEKERSADFWSIQEPRGAGVPSPTVLAMQVNEAVQHSWDSVVRAVAGDGAGDIHDGLSSGVMGMIDSLGNGDLMRINTGIDTYVQAFRDAAAADGTPASAQALVEFLAVIEPVREELESSIASARSAVQQSHEARSLSQRAFLAAVAYAELRQAREVAQRCQDATMGVRGIVPNAFDMQSLYVDANAAALAAGLVNTDLATAREGNRP